MKIDDYQIDINKFHTSEHLKKCLECIDLTSLNATDTDAKIELLVKKVNLFPEHFPHLPYIAALCVFPSFTPIVRKSLTAKGVRIAATSAGFPASHTFLTIKRQECRMAVEEGAHEVDIVLPFNHFLSGNYTRATEEISAIKESIGKAHLKVILESGALDSPQAIALASRIAIEGGADFIKTSTGKSSPAATPEAAVVMCREIKAHFQKTGKRIGFKPAGGIVSVEDALTYYAITDAILGPEWLTPELFRIGASRLANNLLYAISGVQEAYF